MGKGTRPHQATVKRLRITKNKKVVKKTAGQNHFNSRESGKTGMAKRRSIKVAHVNYKGLSELIPGTKIRN